MFFLFSASRTKQRYFMDCRRTLCPFASQVSKSLGAPLQGVRERAKGIVYSKRMATSWTMPAKYREMTEAEAKEVRERFFVDVNGTDVPPPFRNFKDMRFPQPILDALKKKNITAPTQIQMQVRRRIAEERERARSLGRSMQKPRIFRKKIQETEQPFA